MLVHGRDSWKDGASFSTPVPSSGASSYKFDAVGVRGCKDVNAGMDPVLQTNGILNDIVVPFSSGTVHSLKPNLKFWVLLVRRWDGRQIPHL